MTESDTEKVGLSYWRLHFGTDVLMSCWFLLISTIFFVLIPVNAFIADRPLSSVDKVYYSCLIVSGGLYLLGNVFFLTVSYPDAMEDLMVSVMNTDLEKLSFMQKYFIGNNLLLMTWFFAIATLPLIVYYLWATFSGTVGIGFGIAAIIAITISFLSLLFWVVACFPHNMVKNEGRGSSYFIDFLVKNNLLCGLDNFWKSNFSGDFLVGSWILFVLTWFSLPTSIVYFAKYPSNFDSYMLFLSALFFFLGAGLLVHASYPGNFTSDISWQLITCTYSGKSKLFQSDLVFTMDETTPLSAEQPYETNPIHDTDKTV